MQARARQGFRDHGETDRQREPEGVCCQCVGILGLMTASLSNYLSKKIPSVKGLHATAQIPCRRCADGATKLRPVLPTHLRARATW